MKTDENVDMRYEMASMMHICAGLVGPKSENVEKPLVFKAKNEVYSRLDPDRPAVGYPGLG